MNRMNNSPNHTETSEARSARRQRSIDAINRRLPPPTDDEMRSLREHDAESWGEYIVGMARECGVSVSNAFAAFEILGPTEAFDGFVTTIEDGGMEE